MNKRCWIHPELASSGTITVVPGIEREMCLSCRKWFKEIENGIRREIKRVNRLESRR